VIVFHGGGFVGLTGAACFAHQGTRSLVYELDPKRVAWINAGPHDFDEFLEMNVAQLVGDGMLRATEDWREVEGCANHVIAVPTERHGFPDLEVVKSVLRQLARLDAVKLISIESTLSPGTASWAQGELARLGREVPEDVSLVVAPRRDVFWGGCEQSLRRMPRVIGGATPTCAVRAAALYNGVSPFVLANSAAAAEMAKTVENALLAVPLSFLLELAQRYSDEVDVREVVALAGTHPRLPKYWLDLGVSGYCVPLAPRYLPELDVLTATDRVIRGFDERVAQLIADRAPAGGHVGFLGLRLKEREPVSTMSHATRLVPLLLNRGRRVYVHDAVLGEEAVTPTGAAWLPLSRLKEMDVVVCALDVPEYRRISPRSLKHAATVFDAARVWMSRSSAFRAVGIKYRLVGERGWLR
jgi:nucleotide sugar dehydrogenase